MTKYSIVLPCFNEAENLPALVDRFQAFTEEWDFELVIVNNGSTDHTASVIKMLEKNDQEGFIISHNIIKNQGYGYGIRSGLDRACGEILAFTHADRQTPPEDVFRAFALYHSGDLDPRKTMIKGFRPGRDKEFITTRGLSFVTRLLTGLNVDDVNGQPKVFHRTLLNNMNRDVNNFAFDPYILYCAKNNSVNIHSLKVEFKTRMHGESKSANSIFSKLKTILGFITEIHKFSS